VPRKTVFIKGNHEDFVWLDALEDPEILPGLSYLPNGTTFDLGGVTVGGVGGCYGPSDYGRRTRSLQGYAKRHYTREDVEGLLAAGRVDVLLTHDAPAGVVFERHRRGAGWASDAAGLDELVLGLRPKVCFFGHHHVRVDGLLDGVPCLALNKVGRPGILGAVEIQGGAGPWDVLGEWPRKEGVLAPGGWRWPEKGHVQRYGKGRQDVPRNELHGSVSDRRHL
jgi:hypothetical protein